MEPGVSAGAGAGAEYGEADAAVSLEVGVRAGKEEGAGKAGGESECFGVPGLVARRGGSRSSGRYMERVLGSVGGRNWVVNWRAYGD